METVARHSSHHHHPPRPRRAFHSISHAARVWFLGGLVFVASQWRSWSCLYRAWSVEPRGPVSPIIGVIIDIQMTAVMRREFGTAEPPPSEVELGRGRANGLVHVHSLPLYTTVGRGPFSFVLLFLHQSQFEGGGQRDPTAGCGRMWPAGVAGFGWVWLGLSGFGWVWLVLARFSSF